MFGTRCSYSYPCTCKLSKLCEFCENNPRRCRSSSFDATASVAVDDFCPVDISEKLVNVNGVEH